MIRHLELRNLYFVPNSKLYSIVYDFKINYALIAVNRSGVEKRSNLQSQNLALPN